MTTTMNARTKPNTFKHIDLFSGIGGFKLAVDSNGGNSIGFSEIDKDAINYYCDNFGISPEENFGDITKIQNLPKHDLLTAGVPCQSWSIAGKNHGFDDDRGQLWNDTIFLLNQSKPKAFIFENVKGLVDPRNADALEYIMKKIQDAGYHAKYYVLNSYEYGVPQNRVRVYIIGFKNKTHFDKFRIPINKNNKTSLADILEIKLAQNNDTDLLGDKIKEQSMSLSTTNGFNDYFLFNDIRNGDTTIHSWDLIKTTDREKSICYLLLKNRRKKIYGILDGNAMSFEQLQGLDQNLKIVELEKLVNINILKKKEYSYKIKSSDKPNLSKNAQFLLSIADNNILVTDECMMHKEVRKQKFSVKHTIQELIENNCIVCNEYRFDFKQTKISTGLFGINRIFLPTSKIFSTLVASGTNDYVATKQIEAINKESYRNDFLKNIFEPKNYRRIKKEEACLIQGFPKYFKLPDSPNRWMKLLGNSVSVPVVEALCSAIACTGALDSKTFNNHNKEKVQEVEV